SLSCNDFPDRFFYGPPLRDHGGTSFALRVRRKPEDSIVRRERARRGTRANREWCVFRGRQSVSRCKRSSNVGTLVASHLGVVFQPEEEPLFELVTERLPDMESHARLEALHPPRNGAARN